MSTDNEMMIRKQIAEDFSKLHQGNMEQSILDENVQIILSETLKYHCEGQIMTAMFYVRVEVGIELSPVFHGNGGGLFTLIGGGALIGDIYVYCGSLENLYKQTKTFEVHCVVGVAGYCDINFIDKNSKLLASFHAGAFGLCAGTGGGTGKW